MKIRFILLFASAGLLASCDAAMEQVSGQVRTAVVEQCQSVSEGLGIAGEFVAPVCECTADTFMEKNADEITQIDRARIEEIVRTCAADTGAAKPDTATETTSA
ncbi:hypothetical protein QWY75_02445 [Pontixanthobacter aestiaquae]|uniref:Cysteine rich repeat-containing protein n=1 Tax=Pontixanthobacter aestiaquae TaxID=1509367 RepID=A0A844ZA74_9SPHN|nr:hypothetical protein [Pontixanthobacter aestiaquae]MDN3645063.1 hypothetical protein [Pontixanthobacter aestiaquae]MXO83937.1 hypothetical protein [Pontixanthobacter aestiaquae]